MGEGAIGTRRMEGVFPILITPFDERGRVDEESLCSVVDFNIEAGVHGLGVALGSEVFRFTEEERRRVTRVVSAAARGRVPVVINTGAQGTEVAVHYSRMAEEDGADALMVMPPTFVPAGPAEVRQYFAAISAAVNLPIFIQDAAPGSVAGPLARAIAEECENVRYVKVETMPTPPRVEETVAAAGELLTVFGGAGGNYILEELRRGARGTMPSCSQPEAYVELWNRWEAGDEPGARDVFNRLLIPFNRIANLGWGAFYVTNKELLRRRGVIRCAHVRGPLAPLDSTTRRELEALIDEVYG